MLSRLQDCESSPQSTPHPVAAPPPPVDHTPLLAQLQDSNSQLQHGLGKLEQDVLDLHQRLDHHTERIRFLESQNAALARSPPSPPPPLHFTSPSAPSGGSVPHINASSLEYALLAIGAGLFLGIGVHIMNRQASLPAEDGNSLSPDSGPLFNQADDSDATHSQANSHRVILNQSTAPPSPDVFEANFFHVVSKNSHGQSAASNSQLPPLLVTVYRINIDDGTIIREDSFSCSVDSSSQVSSLISKLGDRLRQAAVPPAP